MRKHGLELDSIKKIYAGYSHVYDALFKRFFYPRIKHAINYMHIKPGERVLDVGVSIYRRVPGLPGSGGRPVQMLKKAKEGRQNRLAT
jgi:hypothetical protein